MIKTLVLDNKVEELSKLAGYIEEFADEAGIDPSLAMSLNLALEEAATNVVLYAYPEGTHGTLEIIGEVKENILTFFLKDSGVAFDPTEKEDADVTLGIEERPIGGLGIFLIRQLMDSVSYERKDGQNILKMTKKLN